MWIYVPILVLMVAVYMVSYILLRTAGDGRPALERLAHPSRGGLQEEYGGDGHGNPLEGYGPRDPARTESVDRTATIR
jgi:hypothetical protein